MWYDYREVQDQKTDITMSLDAKTAKELAQIYHDTLRKNALSNVLVQIRKEAAVGQFVCKNIEVPTKHKDYIITELGLRGFEVKTVAVNNDYYIIVDVSWEEKEDNQND